jgi:hypothetical protein
MITSLVSKSFIRTTTSGCLYSEGGYVCDLLMSDGQQSSLSFVMVFFVMMAIIGYVLFCGGVCAWIDAMSGCCNL